VLLTILRGTLAVYLAVVAFVMFVVGSAHQLPGASGDVSRLLVAALGLLVALGPFLVASYLVLNGITMARRESIRLGNLLSLMAGIGLFALVGLMVIAIRRSQCGASLGSADGSGTRLASGCRGGCDTPCEPGRRRTQGRHTRPARITGEHLPGRG
jgi:hypothetical protein